ncbi:fibronectin type III domain-containing protein [Xanthocytophaga flavus]|nr:fibronectin type III domain-containing protein [Xanthocytophaga flavus]
MKIRFFLIYSILLYLCFPQAWAQVYPVQATTQLLPPYSVYLSDYAQDGNDKLRLILLQRDLTQPSYQLRLAVRIELNGKTIIQTAPHFTPAPITLDPGIPTILSGAELAPYLDSRNLDFVGYDRSRYEQTRALPEGAYTLCVTAYDYRRQDVQVSNPGCSFYYLSKNEPPLIAFPACGTLIPSKNSQPIFFQWTPRNTSSPNSAAETEYELSLYEIRPKGRNPNDIVLSTRPVFQLKTDQSQYVYTLADPMLLDSMQYAWRVRAIDKSGRDAFRNQGYSEVCTFTYGGANVSPDFAVGQVKDFTAIGVNTRQGKFSWKADSSLFAGYQIDYRRVGSSASTSENSTSENTTSEKSSKKKTEKGSENAWFPAKIESGSVAELKVYDLEPDTEYEARIQGQKQGFFGPYSSIVTFRTAKPVLVACGHQAVVDSAISTKPLIGMTIGSILVAGDSEIMVEQISDNPQPGYYSGMGRVSMRFLAGAAFRVSLSNIFVNEDHKITQGKVEMLSRGVDAMAKQQLAAQQTRQDIRSLAGLLAGLDTASTATLLNWAQTLSQLEESVISETLVLTSSEKQQLLSLKHAISGTAQQLAKQTAADSTSRSSAVSSNSSSSNTSSLASSLKQDFQKAQPLISKLADGVGKGVLVKLTDLFESLKEDLSRKQLKKQQMEEFISSAQELLSDTVSHDKTLLVALQLQLDSLQQKLQVEWYKSATASLQLVSVPENDAASVLKAVIAVQQKMEALSETQITNCDDNKVPEKLRKLAVRASGGVCDTNVDSEIETIPDTDFAKLCAAQRVDLMECLASGYADKEDKNAIIRIIKTTPGSQGDLLFTKMQERSGLMESLHDAVDFAERKVYYQELIALYKRSKTAQYLSKQTTRFDQILSNGKSSLQQLATHRIIFYKDIGLIDAATGEKRINYDGADFSDRNVVPFKGYLNQFSFTIQKFEGSYLPFEMVRIFFKSSSESLDQGTGEVYDVPAFALRLIIEEQWDKDMIRSANVAGLLAGGMSGGLAAGGWTRLWTLGDMVLSGAALTIDNYREELLSTKAGKDFLNAYEVVNNAIAAYQAGKAVIGLGVLAYKLRQSWKVLKVEDPSLAAKVEQSSEEVAAKADELEAKAGYVNLLDESNEFTDVMSDWSYVSPTSKEYTWKQYFDNLRNSALKPTSGNYGINFEKIIQDGMNKYGLTKGEGFALFGYTTNFYFKELNSFLRKGINSERTLSIKNLLNTALDKMPVVPANTQYYRGLKLADDDLVIFMSKHQKDKEVVYEEFISCANNRKDAFIDEIENNVKIFITTKPNSQGRTIHDMALFKYRKTGATMDEALFKTGSAFEVTNVKNPEPNVFEIYLKEIEKEIK